MTDQKTDAFCTQCGTGISSSARFCRACGSAQEERATAVSVDEAATLVHPPAAKPLPPLPSALPPLPPPPPLPPLTPHPEPYGHRAGASGASILAICGGAGMLLIALCAIAYYPLHYHYPVNYGEPVRFGDVLVVVSAAAAIAVGIWTIRRPVISSSLPGLTLLGAGAPTLALTVLWAYPETFHLTFYPPPFYSGFAYFTRFGQAHIGSGYLQVPLAVASTAVVLAGTVIWRRSARPARDQW
jgi:hypothetical protein